ncbi:MAG TPA: hypothetical protein VKZ44_04540 [Taishania sp.]|nr:hypothetical protein [Taishania sp.]
MINQTTYYQKQIETHTALLDKVKSKHRVLSFARLFAFLLIPISWYLLDWGIVLLGIVVAESALFVFLVNKWLDAKLLKEKHELYIELNSNELKLIQGDWSSFEDGSEFKSGAHPYSNDMDLFGPKSVFQYLNRTVLPLGKVKLANTLAYGSANRVRNQEMIEEISKHILWAQQFIVESKVYLKEEQKQQSLKDLKEQDFNFSFVSILKWVLPVISITSIVLYNLDYLKFGQLLLIGMVVLSVIGSKLKITNKWMHLLSNRSEKISALKAQLELFHQLNLVSEEGKRYKEQLFGNNGMQDGLRELEKIKIRSDYRMNAIVGLLLNYLFAWDFHLLDQSKKWHKQYADSIELWEEWMGEVEVWISGAIYKYNRGETCFAEISTSQEMMIHELGHPFVATNKQVCNDFHLKEGESFLIITGPNMAGKSTYLRSVGLAIISANAGFPILAKSCVLPKYNLYSSMRTSDDLTVESSYFHAELTRLRFIMDGIERGEPTFVILDEILKGTNSKDKEIGSAGFLEKLNRIGAKGIIATHDLSLTNLASTNASFRNVYFDSLIEEDELFFDYKVRDGVCKNMNASFLLRKMNLVDA